MTAVSYSCFRNLVFYQLCILLEFEPVAAALVRIIKINDEINIQE